MEKALAFLLALVAVTVVVYLFPVLHEFQGLETKLVLSKEFVCKSTEQGTECIKTLTK